ncbi:mRNA-capping enzyme-like isoform X1 [Abrus precatorius]|uniref:mRNA guanylyltransferase n=1 Tax=Abrus precatorius TaxID=3816 RepID=A0A8B8L2M0_ABRPR|nr:mRNA-capping enzyme-like isoform X1 [Abrus precatorius]
MIVAMDLNALPVPEEDEDDFGGQVEEYNAPEERMETAVDIARREREERKRRLKKERSDDRSVLVSRSPGNDQLFHTKILKSYDRSKLPPGWLDCPSCGQEIFGTIPSKVPLGESFNDYIIPGKRFSFKQVIHQQRVLGKKIGLVIDLTNTSRYYPVADLKKEGIKHVKIQCKGRDSVPDNVSVNHFVYEVTQFLSRQKQSRKYILVHCTHGYNRTGYMIIHYLMRKMSMSVTLAIKVFSDARPPGIYKPEYIEALYAFYHEKKPEMIVCPPTPEWKRTPELVDLNGEAVPDNDDDDGIPGSPLHENHKTDTIMTNDDILGDEIPNDQQDAFRQFCFQTLKLGLGTRGHMQFPGSHPVSLNRDNLQLLRQRYYYATWKADGTRYMMLITMDGCYLIDRCYNFRRVQMRFPCRVTNDGLAEKTHQFTLLDGEMIIDTLPDSKRQERRYLIYDLMAVNGVSVIERPFYERWKMLEKGVIEPRNQERFQCRNPYYRYDMEPFRVRRKDFWLLSAVTKLLNEFIPKLSHDADGLIFQGWDDPYIPRTHEGLLKWKYADLNSVDFLFEVIDNDCQLLFLYERGKKKLMEGYRVAFEEDSDPLLFSGKIIECSWDSDRQEWIFKRVRTDKSTPNDFNTYKKVMRSIRDNITEDILLNEINEIIRLPMYADRIRIDSKAHHHTNMARRR